MSAEFMVICKKILFRNCVIVSLFVFTYNTWAQCNNNIKIMRKYESEGKYTVRNLVKNKAWSVAFASRFIFIRTSRAVPTGFEPAISALTGPHVWPLHHGSNTLACGRDNTKTAPVCQLRISG